MTIQSTTPDPSTLWTALVLTDDAAVFARGNNIKEHQYVPPGMLTDPAWLLDSVSGLFLDEGTLIVPRVPGPYHDPEWAALDYPDQLRRLIEDARRSSWRVSDIAVEHGYGWVNFAHPARPAVHMGILPHITAGYDQLVDPNDKPAEIAALLARYRDATGVAWRNTAGVAGVQMIRAYFERPVRTPKGTRQRRQPLWIEATDPEMTGAGDLMWSRRLAPEEKTATTVTQFDIRMAYGAAAGMAELPVDGLEATGAEAFDPLAAGYWRVVVPPAWWSNPHGRYRPPVINPARMTGRTVWLTTPMMTLLAELKVYPEVIDSYTTTHTDRLLRGWYERLRDARVMVPSADAPRLSAAIKATANAAIGMMRSGRGRIQRRIWADTIIDLARANLYRKIYTAAGAVGWPFRIEHDSAWYAMGQPMRVYEDALKISPRMGSFRIHQSWTAEQYDHEQRERAQLARKSKSIRRRSR